MVLGYFLQVTHSSTYFWSHFPHTAIHDRKINARQTNRSGQCVQLDDQDHLNDWLRGESYNCHCAFVDKPLKSAQP